MKSTKILAILLVAVMSVSLLATVVKPDKVPKAFEAIWDALVDLQGQIDTIELTPGPLGPKGDKGDKGDTGPQGELPIGVIVMWSGSISTIPGGWALCDGSDGTPDLTDRFIYGVSDAEDPGATGGSATHAHSYSDLPQHSHGVTDPGHAHFLTMYMEAGGSGQVRPSEHVPTGGEDVSVSSATTGITINDSGKASCSTDAANGLPPYYKLAFIMKL